MRKLLIALASTALVSASALAENTPAQNMADIRTSSAKVTQTIVKMMCHNHSNPAKCKPIAEAAVLVLRKDERNLQEAERAYNDLLRAESHE